LADGAKHGQADDRVDERDYDDKAEEDLQWEIEGFECLEESVFSDAGQLGQAVLRDESGVCVWVDMPIRGSVDLGPEVSATARRGKGYVVRTWILPRVLVCQISHHVAGSFRLVFGVLPKNAGAAVGVLDVIGLALMTTFACMLDMLGTTISVAERRGFGSLAGTGWTCLSIHMSVLGGFDFLGIEASLGRFGSEGRRVCVTVSTKLIYCLNDTHCFDRSWPF
jgi:hypothetical protein